MSVEKNIPNEKSEDQKSRPAGRTGKSERVTAALEDSSIQHSTSNIQHSKEMEVHKHPHHVTHTKKWGEYLLEFLMLFLAVLLGFLAENQREHMVEHQREKQYVRSLIADLKSDQQVLSRHVSDLKTGIVMMDSMVTILSTPSQMSDNTGQLYYLARLAPRLNTLSTNNRTFEQLKNSGSFRLIANLSTSNKIMTYYEKFPLIRLLESVNETEFNEYKKVAAKIFDPIVFLEMEGNNNEIRRTIENPPLRTNDKESLQELSIFSVYMHGTKKGILGAAEELKTTGLGLIEYLEKEYHL